LIIYNKIFTKILDSSIWLEPTPTRIIWLTMLAAMDEDGFVQFASVANLAHRAILPLEEAATAVTVLESPDLNSSDPDNEGRRIEKVPGGWIVLNASKYREMVTRVVIKEQTRKRVAAHREKSKCNATVTLSNESVTPSDTASVAKADSETGTKAKKSPSPQAPQEGGDFNLSSEPETVTKDSRHYEITSQIGKVYKDATGETIPVNGKFLKSLSRFLKIWPGTSDAWLDRYHEVLHYRKEPYAGVCVKATDPHYLCENWASVAGDLERLKSNEGRNNQPTKWKI